MAKAIAITRKRFTPLDLAVSTTVSGALNQTYDAAYQSYAPDRSLLPLEILVMVRATDPAGVIFPGIINKSLTDIRWYENVVDDSHNILDSDTRYVIDRTSDTDERGKVTVKVNTPLEGVVLIFTAKYNDPRDGKVLNVSASVSLGVTMSTDEPLRVKVDYPYGQVVDPTENRDFIEIDNVMTRGDSESEGTVYRWQEKSGSDYTDIAEGDKGITGAYTGKLKVPCTSVGKRMDLRCVSDVLPDLAGLNLVSKAMISDDWNAISAGVSTPGEDADGKYFKIHNLGLRKAFGDTAEDDIFGGKIKYKPGQRYVLSVNAKSLAPGDVEAGVNALNFKVWYTDGTLGLLSIKAEDVTRSFYRFVTAGGKTVERVGTSYRVAGYVAIYDIQLVEYHGENLVEGGSKEMMTGAGGASLLCKISKPGSFSLRFEKSVTTTGDATARSAILYDNTDKKIVSNNGININDGNVMVLTASDALDLTHDIRVLLYGSPSLKNNVEAIFYNLMLVEGEYTVDTMPAYTPAVGEFVPAIADGGERWQDLTGNEITTGHVLSTRYPVCDTEIVAPAMLLDETSVFEARAVMHSNRGDIQNPELYWSFPWKDKSGAIFARGSKVFIDESQFSNGELEYSVEPVEGLGEAKWAASFNGIDQSLSNNNPTSIYPWGYDSKRIHVLDFIINELPVGDAQMIPLYMSIASTTTKGFAIAILGNGKIQYRVGTNKDATSKPDVKIGSTIIKPGVLYRVQVEIEKDGTLSAMVNGIKEILTNFGAAVYSSSTIRFGTGSTTSYFNGKLLRYEIFNQDKSVYHLWDFQPTNENRANMLKNKDANGTVKGVSNLTPVNVPNIDVVDPENGFFVTI